MGFGVRGLGFGGVEGLGMGGGRGGCGVWGYRFLVFGPLGFRVDDFRGFWAPAVLGSRVLRFLGLGPAAKEANRRHPLGGDHRDGSGHREEAHPARVEVEMVWDFCDVQLGCKF